MANSVWKPYRLQNGLLPRAALRRRPHAEFEPTKYKDRYQENLRALLDAKVQGKEMEERRSRPALAPVVDILEALKASLARKKQPGSINIHIVHKDTQGRVDLLSTAQDRPMELSHKRR